MKKAIIKIINRQQGQEPIEVVTKGEFTEKNGKYYVRYKENEETGFDGTSTTIKIEEDKMSIKRRGALTSDMEFHTKNPYKCLYSTNMGDLYLNIETSLLKIDVDATGGNIYLIYSLNLDENQAVVTKMSIEITVE